MTKIILSTFLSLFAATLFAQDSAATFSFNHQALSVKDLNISADFYKNVLGLREITNRSKLDGVRWFSLNDQQELHLISFVKEPVEVNKAVHLGLTTNITAFDAFVRKLDSLKIIYSDWPGNLKKINIRADGIKQVFFQDPNGYWIEINSVPQ
jgi:lactoylglutathione lyase